MGTDSLTTGLAPNDSSTAAMLSSFKVPNTGKADTLYPIRKNLNLQNARFFCVSVGAQTSYHIQWPQAQYCEITIAGLTMPDGSEIARITGQDARTLAEALPMPLMNFTVDHRSDNSWQQSQMRSKITIDCENANLCTIEFK